MQENILVVDDDQVAAEMLAEALIKNGYNAQTATNGADAVERGRMTPFDVVITDVKMPGMDGLAVLRAFKEINPRTVVIMVTAFASITSAIQAMKEGAYDYISKPFHLDEVLLVVQRSLEQKTLKEEHESFRRELQNKYRLENIIGRSPQMLDVYKVVAKAAESRSTVLIQGESGTGKELIARAIHYNSPRASRPFVAVNCASFSEGVLESELFGHVKGAFTGAITTKKGIFEEANQGTIFLDEIGDISLSLQAKLLRVLQEHQIRRVGGTESINVDIRIVAATNKDLYALMKEGSFREDLFYRLNVINITLPPLRERKSDIPLLTEYFLRKYAMENGRNSLQFSKEAMDMLMEYSWPGNVRELENVIERAVTLTSNITLTPDDLPPKLRKDIESQEISMDSSLTLDELERRYVLQILRGEKGNKKRTAEILGIDRKTLYRMLHRYGIGSEEESI